MNTKLRLLSLFVLCSVASNGLMIAGSDDEKTLPPTPPTPPTEKTWTQSINEFAHKGGWANPLNIRATWGESKWKALSVGGASFGIGALFVAAVSTKTTVGKKATRKVASIFGYQFEEDKSCDDCDENDAE